MIVMNVYYDRSFNVIYHTSH